MSLLDQVRKLEQQVLERLKELEPLTREYEQLRKVAERLGIKYPPRSADADANAPEAARRGGSRATAQRRTAASGAASTAGRSSGRSSAAKTPAKTRGTRSTTPRRAARSARTAGAGASAKTAPAGSRRRSGSGTRSGGRRATAARPGQRHDDVLRLVTEHPGITVREIAERLGVDATGLYRVVKRLTDDGRVRKDGTRLHPIEPATTSAPAPGRAAASASQTADDEAQRADAAATAEPESSAAATETAPSADT